MASLLISDCLTHVFSNLIEHPSSDASTDISTKDLYSCTLVSRHWCRISTPFLYAYPFHHLKNQSHPKDSYCRLIRTLLSCVPQSEIKEIYTSYTSYALTLLSEYIPLTKKKFLLRRYFINI